MTKKKSPPASVRWARFRFSVVGPLLSAPPARGQLQAAIEALAEKTWIHPITGRDVRYTASTIERWYYKARNAKEDPVGELRRAVRKDAGRVSVSPQAAEYLRQQYDAHPHWTYQLHYDNLVSAARHDADLAPVRSYATIRRYMKTQGMVRRRRQSSARPGEIRAARRRESCEIRSYESEYVGALWHLDFHHGSRKVLTPQGQWQRPIALGVMDDHSRLCCHLQWYLSETAENLVHGFSQSLQKRGLPRALLTDNGAAMISDEFTEGLSVLGIVHEKTLPYSPYQNGKQERLWATMEGRLMEMLEGVEPTLDFLNVATQAWMEIEYNRAVHRELSVSPAGRFDRSPCVLRPCPTSEALREAFRLEATRTQRRSDGTITLEGVRFEVPSRFRHFRCITVRYARWDLGHVDLVDPKNGTILARLFPLDRVANADGHRAPVERDQTPEQQPPADKTPESGGSNRTVPPLLQEILDQYAATGLPPAYLPKPSDSKKGKEQA